MAVEQNTIAKFDRNMEIREADEHGLVWFAPDEAPFELTGFHWYEQDKVFRRFPVNPPEKLPDGVEYLAWHTSGGKLRFRTDSNNISIRVKLLSSEIMDHMPRTGSNGFDLYVGAPGKERFYSVTRCGNTDEFTYALLNRGDAQRMRDITIYFPLYQGVNKFEIGVAKGTALLPPAPLKEGYVAVYGSSIAQGGCCCRPGMSYTNLLSRALRRDVYNYGFSGSGRGEPEVARLLAQLDPKVYLLDYEPNCVNMETYRKTLPEFISILRAAHPETKILLLSQYRFSDQYFDSSKKNHVNDIRESIRFQKTLVENLRKSGDKNIVFHNGLDILGPDGYECTVDGCHASDLGFYRMAKALAPVLRRLLR